MHRTKTIEITSFITRNDNFFEVNIIINSSLGIGILLISKLEPKRLAADVYI